MEDELDNDELWQASFAGTQGEIQLRTALIDHLAAIDEMRREFVIQEVQF